MFSRYNQTSRCVFFFFDLYHKIHWSRYDCQIPINHPRSSRGSSELRKLIIRRFRKKKHLTISNIPAINQFRFFIGILPSYLSRHLKTSQEKRTTRFKFRLSVSSCNIVEETSRGSRGECYLVAATLSRNALAGETHRESINAQIGARSENDRGKCAFPCRRRRGRVAHPDDESVIDRPNCDCLSHEADAAWSEERRRRRIRYTDDVSRSERNARNKKKREIQAGATTIRFCYLIAGAD